MEVFIWFSHLSKIYGRGLPLSAVCFKGNLYFLTLICLRLSIQFSDRQFVVSTGDTYPSAAVPRSISAVSSAGSIQPPPAAVTGTTSTLTDSVFLSGSGSSRKNFTCNSTLQLVTSSYSYQFEYHSTLPMGAKHA